MPQPVFHRANVGKTIRRVGIRPVTNTDGNPLLAAHRLEAAYFYAPDGPTIAALDLRRPLSHMSAATMAYAGGAGLLWLSALVLSFEWVGLHGEGSLLLGWVPIAAIVWTLVIAGYLVWTWLRRPDEARLLAELDLVYPDGARSSKERERT